MTKQHKQTKTEMPRLWFGASEGRTPEEMWALWPAVSDDDDALRRGHRKRGRQTLQAANLYEITVRGAFDSAVWADWFADMTFRTRPGGLTVLKGSLPDQAALYGLLSRMRELGLALIALRPLPGRRARGGVWRRIWVMLTRVNWLLVIAYLLLAGALSALTVFLAGDILHVALALAALFAALGAIAVAFIRWDRGVGWKFTAAFWGLGALITLLIYLPVSGLLPAALGIALMLITFAALLLGGFAWVKSLRETRAVQSGDVSPTRALQIAGQGTEAGLNQPLHYEIRFKGRLEGTLGSDLFSGMQVSVDDGFTILRGSFDEPAALYRLIARLRDFALPLVSIRMLEPAPTDRIRPNPGREI